MQMATEVPDIISQKPLSRQVTEITGQRVSRVRLTDNSVLVRVHLGHLGTNKSVRANRLKVESEDGLVKVHKRLLQSPELKALDRLDFEIRKYVYSRTLKPGTFGSGIYFLGMPLVEEFEKTMRGYKAKRKKLVEDLINRYDQIVESDKLKLSAVKVSGAACDISNAEDYPPVAVVRKKFQITWQYMALVPPKSLMAVSEDLYMQAEEQMRQDIEDASETVRMALRQEVKQLIDWAVERLSPSEGPDAKKKMITSRMTGRINEFLEVFSGRNITNDVELKSLVDKARVVMLGVTADGLRSSEPLRETTQKGFAEIKGIIDTWVVEQPSRAIEVD